MERVVSREVHLARNPGLPLVFVKVAVCAAAMLTAAAAWSAKPSIDKASANLERALAQPLSRLDDSALRVGDDGVARGYRVDVVLEGDAPGISSQLEAAGASVHGVSARYGRASISVPGASVARAIARIDAVEMMYPEYGFVTSVGSVDSRAPKALRVDGGRTNEGFRTADGERVGILSDSFARTSGVVDSNTTTDGTLIDRAGNRDPVILEKSKPQDSDDLPDKVELRRDDAASPLSDEGAAMAVLVHDMARDAAISFHTVGNNVAVFAQGIDELCTPRASGGAGASVVVDDVLFFRELMYQRGPIAQAAEDCVARGTPFLSAAGNAADNGFRRDFADIDSGTTETAPSTTNDGISDRVNALDTADLHDWGGDAADDPGYVAVRIPEGGVVRAALQWNQPALSVPDNGSNGPRIDLDLLVLDAPDASDSSNLRTSNGTQVSSFNDQDYELAGEGADPFEFVGIRNPPNGSGEITVYLAVDHWGGNIDTIPQNSTTDLEFRLVLFESSGDAAIQYVDFDGGPGDSTMYGHSTGAGVVSLGAVPWFDTAAFDPTFNPTTETDPESFTAKGGQLPIQFARDGAFLGEQTTRLHPRLAAVDGNNTTFFGQSLNLGGAFGEPDTFPNFFGTSAAAPNAAAVVAGVQGYSAEPLAPSKVESLIRSEAIDITGQRAASGVDDVTGVGLIDAQATLDRFPTAVAEGPGAVDLDAKDLRLDGRASTAPAAIDTFTWRQTEGPTVALRDTDQAVASFDAPDERTTLKFELVVRGDSGLTHADSVTVPVGQTLKLSQNSNSGGGGALGWIWVWLVFAIMRSVSVRASRDAPR